MTKKEKENLVKENWWVVTDVINRYTHLMERDELEAAGLLGLAEGIDKFKEGDSIQGFYLCFEKHIRHSRNGDLFIDVRLRDKTGSINAKIWDNVNVLKKKFVLKNHDLPSK